MRVSVKSVLVSLLMCTCISLGNSSLAGETYSYKDLIERLVDLEHISMLPEKGETGKMWSSYDRSSKFDEEKGQYVNWAANGDGTGFIRKEGDQIVMAEMQGPGCIWRIWSAKADDGHVKIFLDGNDEPVIDLAFKDYFTGMTQPFNYPALSYNNAASGKNLYFPIPYQKSCKIIADPGWGMYYQFTYTTFPDGTKVPTFSADISKNDMEALNTLNDFLTDNLGNDPAGKRKGEKTISESITVSPGESKIIAAIKGKRAITSFKVKINAADSKEEKAALRELLLKITWDGQKTPSVWCPLGDFFGTAPGINKYKSLVLGMTDEGLYSYWYMPFGKRAVVELVNEGKAERKLDFSITHSSYKGSSRKRGLFHCKWQRDMDAVSKDRWPDWGFMKMQGKGRFCGIMLHVWNPLGGWWGEGDEKFFVDGETIPSTFGTGTEDYFGYAWCNPSLFQKSFHGQTMTQGNAGHQSVFRWQISDNVPFQKSFEGYMEKYWANDRPTLYAVTKVWYMAPGGSDSHKLSAVEDRTGYDIIVPRVIAGINVLSHSNGIATVQNSAHWPKDGGDWDNDDHVYWIPKEIGDTLDMAVPVEKTGRYNIELYCTKANDYAIVQFLLDGKEVGKPVDLYNPTIVRTPAIVLGAHELTKGEHKLTVRITGANEKAIKQYMFGLDLIKLTEAD